MAKMATLRTILFILMLLGPFATYAKCDCVQRQDIETMFDESDIVFHGKIAEILQEEKLRNLVNFKIKKIWKGALLKKNVEVLASRYTAVCETSYAPEVEYVIYAKWEREAGFYSVDSCGGWSKYYSDVKMNELNELQELKQ